MYLLLKEAEENEAQGKFKGLIFSHFLEKRENLSHVFKYSFLLLIPPIIYI
jgi:hypothetical protein